MILSKRSSKSEYFYEPAVLTVSYWTTGSSHSWPCQRLDQVVCLCGRGRGGDNLAKLVPQVPTINGDLNLTWFSADVVNQHHVESLSSIPSSVLLIMLAY